MLTDKQIKQFKNDGLVLVPELFNKSKVELNSQLHTND